MKRFIAIALILILIFSLASCGIKDDIKPDDNGSSEKIQETQKVDGKPVVDPDDSNEEITEDTVEDPTPPEPVWGPLTAEFLALLAGKNYYIKLELAFDITGDAESDIGILPFPSDAAQRWHRVETARQDDLYAWVRWFSTNKSNEPSQHTINNDDKNYGINHQTGKINVRELSVSSADDTADFFPVSVMCFIESGMGSVNGVTMPYENYTRSESCVWRFYINDDKVEYCMRIMSDGSVMDFYSLMETSRDVPSRMFELPASYTVVEIEPRNSSEIPQMRTPPE